ncbi:hypothetical protein DFAR_4000027 [Desulfarculales bacterium]
MNAVLKRSTLSYANQHKPSALFRALSLLVLALF